jgi:tetratricopeptide (TPR) repeat protein
LNTKNYPEAIQLYSKAIEIKPSDAILYSNRSMCYLSIGKNSEALSDAEQAIQLDGGYAKAYFRKGSALVALSNYSLAKESFEEGLKLAPGDKSFITQLQKLRETPAATAPPTSTHASTPATSSRPQVPKKSAPAPAPSLPENEGDDSELSKFRGYKKTADGRTTTFFNNDLDAETKALIGDIAPKKIDPAVVHAESTSSAGESVWNKAGTWEERVHTPWAAARLKDLLGEISFPLPDGGGSVSLQNVSLTGDAQVVFASLGLLHLSGAGDDGEREGETYL